MNKLDRPQRVTDSYDKIFTNALLLPQQDSGIALSIIRLNNCHIGHYKRRTPVFIMNTRNRKWTIRYTMGNGGTVKELTKASFAIDYDGLCELDVKYKQPTSKHHHQKSHNKRKLEMVIKITRLKYSA